VTLGSASVLVHLGEVNACEFLHSIQTVACSRELASPEGSAYGCVCLPWWRSLAQADAL